MYKSTLCSGSASLHPEDNNPGLLCPVFQNDREIMPLMTLTLRLKTVIYSLLPSTAFSWRHHVWWLRGRSSDGVLCARAFVLWCKLVISWAVNVLVFIWPFVTFWSRAKFHPQNESSVRVLFPEALFSVTQEQESNQPQGGGDDEEDVWPPHSSCFLRHSSTITSL